MSKFLSDGEINEIGKLHPYRTRRHFDLLDQAKEANRLRAEINNCPPIPTELICPECGTPHVDEGEWAAKPHKTHLCLKCGHKWKPYPVSTVGVHKARRLLEGLEALYRGLTETPFVVHSEATAERIRELLEGGE